MDEAQNDNLTTQEMDKESRKLFRRLTTYDRDRKNRLQEFETDLENQENRAEEVLNQINTQLEKAQEIIGSVVNLKEQISVNSTEATNIVREIENKQREVINEVEDYNLQKSNISNLEEEVQGLIIKVQGDEDDPETMEDSLFGKLDTLTEEGKALNDQFRDQLNDQKEQIQSAIDEKEKELAEVSKWAKSVMTHATDANLHGVFETAAINYNKSANYLGIAQIGVLVLIIVYSYYSLPPEISANWDTIATILIKALVISPLVIISIFLFRIFNVQKLLAEEYTHKATLTKVIAGYRELYKLEHEDVEYMELFNSIKMGLNANAADKIATILNKRSPQESAVEKAVDVLEKKTDNVALPKS